MRQLPRQAVAVAAALAAVVPASSAGAQEADEESQTPQPPVEDEVIAVGRFLSAAESPADERISLPFSADFLGTDVIDHVGDADVASALRRVPGITLFDGRFVYVRGLGERYSSVTVNGAAVPSPELTRAVIPLDFFPTSIVESIKIQKSPSPDQPANFGGGSVDIRTASIPENLVAALSVGLGYNTVSDGEGLTYPEGNGSLPQPIRDAIDTYQGNLSVQNIYVMLRATDPLAMPDDARAIHQGLLNTLDTRIGARAFGRAT